MPLHTIPFLFSPTSVISYLALFPHAPYLVHFCIKVEHHVMLVDFAKNKFGRSQSTSVKLRATAPYTRIPLYLHTLI